jgi:tRNA(fMet)-specific endonuclease VapC
MPQYYLDTDTLSLFRDGHPNVLSRVSKVPIIEIGTTIITVEEQLSGWYSFIRKTTKPIDLERGYAQLAKTIRFYARIFIQDFPLTAMTRYQQLKSLKLNIGTMDLRIAAIAIHFGGTVVTRNVRDFSRVPGLMIEDWTLP